MIFLLIAPFIVGIFHGYVSHNQMVMQNLCLYGSLRVDLELDDDFWPSLPGVHMTLHQFVYPLVNVQKAMENHHF